jgi:hypothetical protein
MARARGDPGGGGTRRGQRIAQQRRALLLAERTAALRGVSAGSVLDMLPEPVKDRALGLVELTADQGIITRTNGLSWNRLCARTRVSSGPCGSMLKPVRHHPREAAAVLLALNLVAVPVAGSIQ